MERLNFNEWCDKLPKYLTDKEEHIAITICEKPTVGYCNDDFNKEYCDLNNIPYYNHHGDGGTIVMSEGSIALGFIYNNRKYKRWMLSYLLADLAKHLKTLGLAVTRDRNDILIDGYKVASGCAINLKPDFKWTYEIIQISINQDIEAIKNICKKPMVKIPKGLSEYGITTETIVNWCSNWLSVHLGIDASVEL